MNGECMASIAPSAPEWIAVGADSRYAWQGASARSAPGGAHLGMQPAPPSSTRLGLFASPVFAYCTQLLLIVHLGAMAQVTSSRAAAPAPVQMRLMSRSGEMRAMAPQRERDKRYVHRVDRRRPK